MAHDDDTTAPGARPRRRLVLAAAVALGVFGGLGVFTLGYGDGAAYLSDDPAACANCHVMQDHFDSWSSSSHAHVATCNDCHLSPHPIGKWITKADNGFFHSLAFTTDAYPRPIRIKPRNRHTTQTACIECHGQVADATRPAVHGGQGLSCVHCHSSVGHAQR